MNSFQRKFETQSLGKRIGFTLIELLLVMAIIGALSGLALVVVNEAQYDAQASSTRSRISMLDQILRQRVEMLQEMRLPVDLNDYGVNRTFSRELRRRIIADIIDSQLPRSYYDIGYDQATVSSSPPNFTFPSPSLTEWIDFRVGEGDISSANADALVIDLFARRPSNSRVFRLRESPANDPSLYPEGQGVEELPFSFDSVNLDPTSLDGEDFARITTVSEYLYAVLQTTQFNGISAVEALGNRAFANTDGDLFPEVVDAWGNPIGFQIEIYNDNGELAQFDIAAGATLDLNGNDLDPNAFDVENLRIRIVSTGGRVSASDGSRELITN